MADNPFATSAPSPSSGDGMDGMDGMDMSHGSSGMGSMGSMTMTFQNNPSTPLFGTGWTPSGTGSYAGTCIFLIILAVLFRVLLALKARQEARWLDAELHRRYVAVAGKQGLKETVAAHKDAKTVVLSENGVEEEVLVVQRRGETTRPWRVSVDPLRAAVDTVIAGVGYLLMLAVMTMNVGYFLSVLGGVFLGSLAIGRLRRSSTYGHGLKRIGHPVRSAMHKLVGRLLFTLNRANRHSVEPESEPLAASRGEVSAIRHPLQTISVSKPDLNQPCYQIFKEHIIHSISRKPKRNNKRQSRCFGCGKAAKNECVAARGQIPPHGLADGNANSNYNDVKCEVRFMPKGKATDFAAISVAAQKLIEDCCAGQTECAGVAYDTAETNDLNGGCVCMGNGGCQCGGGTPSSQCI
ncbi:hypothetical protein O988_03179 [Pseudogymnoascus sp. VKM F-3808]|nr:hypothetical protein O988_03179 [Pseudogymnoascus sp. VKM F-3808]